MISSPHPLFTAIIVKKMQRLRPKISPSSREPSKSQWNPKRNL